MSPSLSSTTSSLTPYITAAFGGNLLQNTPYGFTSLSRNKINRIIIYSGSFNPPHIKHAKIIREALQVCRSDYGLVGFVLLPDFDDILRKKLEDAHEALFLPYETRSAMLRQHASPADELTRLPSNTWVYEHPSMMDEVPNAGQVPQAERSNKFLVKLKKLAAEDGYFIEFTGLCQPHESMPQLGMDTESNGGHVWDSYLILGTKESVSWTPPAGHFSKHPQKFEMCDEWQRVQSTDSESNNNSIPLPNYENNDHFAIWECCKTGTTNSYIRYVNLEFEPQSLTSNQVRSVARCIRKIRNDEEQAEKELEERIGRMVIGWDSLRDDPAWREWLA
ncbi:hypothetical protein EJ08DRAFT_649637 [Tothia fuscella]|uniref:Cytidyltransferase-like domain-containing protein n=1 Tax=Tothia fuscella TaxID=1048955 RepID=A0A9P4NQR5_9PEZI|nr:hypothetical protein EJ08DRAFT_649637 [Tothia fuscella]